MGFLTPEEFEIRCMDYRRLLIKYMYTVIEEEGSSFINNGTWTKIEKLVLKKIEKEINQELYS